ncbi:hypothetical protein QAD02_001627 [Eretmocerus hayati]|uniref:Uncharacterized protein n=1 Tax=Eretmocerus hayati TaxID=131215 RepID=A0ACC2NHT3_9HYME|nr:hypothetical protein QAD02_001627 [Eretmocerus hayati]
MHRSPISAGQPGPSTARATAGRASSAPRKTTRDKSSRRKSSRRIYSNKQRRHNPPIGALCDCDSCLYWESLPVNARLPHTNAQFQGLDEITGEEYSNLKNPVVCIIDSARRSEEDMRKTTFALTALPRLLNVLRALISLTPKATRKDLDSKGWDNSVEHSCRTIRGLNTFKGIIESLMVIEDTTIEDALLWMEGELPDLSELERLNESQFHADREFLQLCAAKRVRDSQKENDDEKTCNADTDENFDLEKLFKESLSINSSPAGSVVSPSSSVSDLASFDAATGSIRPSAMRKLLFHRNYSVASGAESDFTVKRALDAIFTCPSCRDLIWPSFFQCVEGHALCGHCRRKGDTRCPVCKTRDMSWQNTLLESVAHRLTFPCKYDFLGCPVMTKANEWFGHKNRCIFRPLIENQPRFSDRSC